MPKRSINSAVYSMAKGHSSIGASSAYRWFECPGSVRLSELAPPQESNIYAAQGTAAHWVIEQYYALKMADKPVELDDFAGMAAPNGHELTDEDIAAVRTFVEYVDSIRSSGKFVMHVEAKFDLSSIHEGLWGTADVALMESNMKRIKIIDYKHGSGIPVEVKHNKQLLYYALGGIKYVCDKHKIDYLSMLGWGKTFKEVEIIVVQPRCRHVDGVVRSWVVPAEALDSFADELKQKAILATKKDAPFKAGDHCRFCPALAICPAFNQKTFELAKADFKGVSHPSNLKLPAPESLSNAEIVKILNFADLITEFLKRVEGHALHLLEHGEDLPGYKLVKKKANRDWKDEEEAKAALSMLLSEAEMYEKKFLSPAKAEKALGKQKKLIESLVFKLDTGNTIAPEHDPREAVSGSAVADFAQLT